MPKNIPNYLKLHLEPAAEPAASEITELGNVERLCKSFAKATGWNLRYEPGAKRASGTSPASAQANGAGLLLTPAIKTDEDPRPRVARQDVEPLATAIAILLGELEQTRQALWQREAELAAGVPIVQRDNEEAHLALRLEAALAGGAAAVGCQAAALYLLDDATSQLKLRASCGLPTSRLLAPARPLRGEIADLEALIGHAVVIENTALLPHWRCPEDFPAAVCVPVSSASTPLGTLWMFASSPRDFSAEQTNLIEIVAGRLAADLERELLLSEGVQARTLERDLSRAARWQEERLPTVAPLVDDWDVAGLTHSSARLASEFFDWSVLPDGLLAVALGDAHGEAITAGLSAAALHSAIKSHSHYRHDARTMLQRVNETLWTGSPGGQFASLFYGMIAPDRGELEYAGVGNLGAVLVHADGQVTLSRHDAPLGGDLEAKIQAHKYLLPAGSALVIVSAGVLTATDLHQRPWDETAIAEFLRRQLHFTSHEMASRLMHALRFSGERDRTVLVVKRQR